MELERRALYNLLRMNWLQDPQMDVEEWQVADYREMTSQNLVKRLEEKELYLDLDTFHQFAEKFDTPEELTDSLLEAEEIEGEEQDAVYLLLFEIWRRLLPEKPCLSIFCDELDHIIFSYDNGSIKDPEAIENALANLKIILDENADQGGKPVQVFQKVAAGCANDLESFLYDYITEQIDLGNQTYAAELYEAFQDYIKDSKWFDLIHCRLLIETDPDQLSEEMPKLLKIGLKDADLHFSLDLLSFLIQGGDRGDFMKLAKKTLPMIETEEDFQDLLNICADFFDCVDEEEREERVQGLLDQRASLKSGAGISRKDPAIETLRKILV